MLTQTLSIEAADDTDEVLVATAVFDRRDPWTWIDDVVLRDRLRHRLAPLAISA